MHELRIKRVKIKLRKNIHPEVISNTSSYVSVV